MDNPEAAWKQLNDHRRQQYNHPEGSTCPVCNGSGHVMTIWSDAEYYHGLLIICPECGNIHLKEEDARRAGNAPRYGDYIDVCDWQRILHRKAGEFAQHPAGVFYIGGQTATGKSHLCSKIYYHIMANGSTGLNYELDAIAACVIGGVSFVGGIGKIRGIVITHGHEDHIGALPYVLRDINVPIYATRLTMGIIENKLTEHNLMKKTKRKVVKFGQSINLGDFRVEFIKTNHSIVDAAALAIYSPAGIVVHTGDFKVDYTPVYGDAIDLQRFAEIGKKGVLALMCDSTNAERPGFTPSEKTVGKTFDTLFEEHKNTRIFVATFASNVDRVQQIINTAYKFGRKVAVEGRSMVNILDTAIKLECINIPENTLVDLDQMKNYPDEQQVIITTGSQGESMAALSRMANNMHRKITIGAGDTVIFSSNPIPGNEKSVTKIINELLRKGADVIFQDAHVSGHACQEEIKLIYTLIHPKYAVPVHGEYKHLKAQAKIAESLGISKDNIFILSSGDVLEVSEEQAKVNGRVPVGAILVDGLGVGDVGNVVLRDRQHLAEDGIMIVVMSLDKASGELVAGPDIVSRGFVYVKESDELIEEARRTVDDALQACLDKGITDWGKLKTTTKDVLSDYVWKKTKRRPMILPIIMEV